MAKKSDKKADDSAPKPKKQGGKQAWKAMDRGATVVGGLMATRAAALAWRGLSGKKAPASGRHPEVTAREMVLYSVVAGAMTELVKTGIRRGTASYWVRSTGELPPGMKPLVAPDADGDGHQASTRADKTGLTGAEAEAAAKARRKKSRSAKKK